MYIKVRENSTVELDTLRHRVEGYYNTKLTDEEFMDFLMVAGQFCLDLKQLQEKKTWIKRDKIE